MKNRIYSCSERNHDSCDFGERLGKFASPGGVFDCVLMDRYIDLMSVCYQDCCFIGPTKSGVILSKVQKLENKPLYEKDSSASEIFKTEFWSKPVKIANLRREYGSVTYFICRLPNLKYALAMADASLKKITTFCPKSCFPPTVDIKASICDYMEKDKDDWTLEAGTCPEVAESVDTGLVVAELLKILVNQGNLE